MELQAVRNEGGKEWSCRQSEMSGEKNGVAVVDLDLQLQV